MRLLSSPSAINVSDGEEDAAFNASFDLDVLVCPVCSVPPSPPIYQCSRGHHICSHCCKERGNKCPTCSRSVGKIRCLMLEKLVESLVVNCCYADYGCSKKVKYARRRKHQTKCPFTPYDCPIPDCSFFDSLHKFSSHFLERHNVRTFSLVFGLWRTLFVGRSESRVLLNVEETYFLLCNDKVELGNYPFIKLFGTYSQESAFVYHLTISKGKRQLSLRSNPPSVLTLDTQISDFLLIPTATYGNEDSLELKMRICRKGYELDI